MAVEMKIAGRAVQGFTLFELTNPEACLDTLRFSPEITSSVQSYQHNLLNNPRTSLYYRNAFEEVKTAFFEIINRGDIPTYNLSRRLAALTLAFRSTPEQAYIFGYMRHLPYGIVKRADALQVIEERVPALV